MSLKRQDISKPPSFEYANGSFYKKYSEMSLKKRDISTPPLFEYAN